MGTKLMRELVFDWLRLSFFIGIINRFFVVASQICQMSQPGIKKSFTIFPRSPSLHHKFQERLAGKPVIQGDESGAGVSFGFV